MEANELTGIINRIRSHEELSKFYSCFVNSFVNCFIFNFANFVGRHSLYYAPYCFPGVILLIFPMLNMHSLFPFFHFP